MTAEEMWQVYCQLHPEVEQEMDAWSFGALPDELAGLVLKGIKTATASAYDEHLYFKEPVSQVGDLSVILNSQNQAVCIIKTTKLTIVPFNEVSANHAYKEGEGDRSLRYWRCIHAELFTQWLAEIGIEFTETSPVVLEEFQVVYSEKE